MPNESCREFKFTSRKIRDLKQTVPPKHDKLCMHQMVQSKFYSGDIAIYNRNLRVHSFELMQISDQDHSDQGPSRSDQRNQ